MSNPTLEYQLPDFSAPNIRATCEALGIKGFKTLPIKTLQDRLREKSSNDIANLLRTGATASTGATPVVGGLVSTNMTAQGSTTAPATRKLSKSVPVEPMKVFHQLDKVQESAQTEAQAPATRKTNSWNDFIGDVCKKEGLSRKDANQKFGKAGSRNAEWLSFKESKVAK